ncbi:hypothetical protein PHYSODRAFT_515163, partial [Phytophthora sojae]
LASAVLGSLECSSLGPPPHIPRGPGSRAPRAGLLRLRSSPPLAGRYRIPNTFCPSRTKTHLSTPYLAGFVLKPAKRTKSDLGVVCKEIRSR